MGTDDAEGWKKPNRTNFNLEKFFGEAPDTGERLHVGQIHTPVGRYKSTS